ncbi:DNA/RNA polymerase [Coemansia reversa NRRL 1564]|uniref:DNA/RNA polymerase n=1 Tax=Coemansia reversa (strain ATCC 12441 / NRRL 1564) TaxID=763665 RepID=A0A2G5BAX4_COERN|nr:DNA/RNA polymerase [Coemansia reversa NRRL 1564]|eukprot:PIA16166.1 DNA/RNA polymerase [Coemansia reversa NRRL 1564]
MPESNPSLPDSNINMEINDNVIREILPASPAVPDAATSEAASNGMRGKVSCETFTSQVTKFSVTDLRMSALSWIAINNREFDAYLPGAPESMRLNAVLPLLTGEVKNAMGQLLFSSLAELYDFLCNSFPQADYELRVQDTARSGKLFIQAPKRAIGTFALAIYKNMNQENLLSVMVIARALFVVNSIPFVVYKIVLDAIHPDEVPEMCRCFNHANKIGLTLGKKKKKHGAGTNNPAPPATNPPAPTISSTASTSSPQGREVSNLMAIPGLCTKDYELRALADTGAKVCLITERAAKRAGITININSRPLLRTLWPDAAPHHSIGRAHIRLQVENGPRIWTHAVVISFGKGWDLLVGGKTLHQLGIQLMSPAMDWCLGAASKAADHPTKTLDGPSTALAVAQTIESAYESMPDTEPSRELSHPSLTETSRAAAPVSEPVVSRPMRARLGLPANYFVPEHDDEFVTLNTLYPEATEASIKERLHHQYATDLHAEALLGELLTGKDAVREYPGGCPPPAAFAPIQPPMHSEYMLSDAARAACDEVVSTRLQYGIDEPLQAFAQLLIFTKAMPNTTEWRLRLSADVADYWTYDGGPRSKLCNRRMVQGNSESPAIAQAFILHVLEGVSGLQSRLLAYIDNIYIKSTDDDMDAHIADVGCFIRYLAKANVTVNMRKSLWCATCDVEILGRTWSADRAWSTFDYRVKTLRDLPLLSNLGAIRRLCGSINAIAEHIEWSQALLAPFYEATGKVRLSKNDIEALCEPWEVLKRALLDVKMLFIPLPGALLVLRTDTAGAGVGAVLLAQHIEDPNDLALVSYFSRAFGACAIYEAVKYFYPYLNGCINLRIETDCGTVVSLFSHKTTSDADPLAQFKLGLTELGVKKYMIVHRRGVNQQIADWLSRAKERVRPDKLPVTNSLDMADTTISAHDMVYTIGMLTMDNEDDCEDDWLH